MDSKQELELMKPSKFALRAPFDLHQWIAKALFQQRNLLQLKRSAAQTGVAGFAVVEVLWLRVHSLDLSILPSKKAKVTDATNKVDEMADFALTDISFDKRLICSSNFFVEASILLQLFCTPDSNRRVTA